MLHNLNVIDILRRQHGVEHAVLLRDPLVGGICFGKQLEERKSVQKPLFAETRQLGEFAVAGVDGRETFEDFGAARVFRA